MDRIARRLMISTAPTQCKPRFPKHQNENLVVFWNTTSGLLENGKTRNSNRKL